MEKGSSMARKNCDVSFAAAANEIVYDRNLVSRLAEMQSDMGTYKTATASDKNVQVVIPPQDPYGYSPGFAVPFRQRRKSR